MSDGPVCYRVNNEPGHHVGGCLGCDREAEEMVDRGWSPNRPVTVIELGNLRVRVCDACALKLAKDLVTIQERVCVSRVVPETRRAPDRGR